MTRPGHPPSNGVPWWELPLETPRAEVHRAYFEDQMERIEQNMRIRDLVARADEQASYPHPYTVHPITGVKTYRRQDTDHS